MLLEQLRGGRGFSRGAPRPPPAAHPPSPPPASTALTAPVTAVPVTAVCPGAGGRVLPGPTRPPGGPLGMWWGAPPQGGPERGARSSPWNGPLPCCPRSSWPRGDTASARARGRGRGRASPCRDSEAALHSPFAAGARLRSRGRRLSLGSAEFAHYTAGLGIGGGTPQGSRGAVEGEGVSPWQRAASLGLMLRSPRGGWIQLLLGTGLTTWLSTQWKGWGGGAEGGGGAETAGVPGPEAAAGKSGR